jgi:hypothetical protein
MLDIDLDCDEEGERSPDDDWPDMDKEDYDAIRQPNLFSLICCRRADDDLKKKK